LVPVTYVLARRLANAAAGWAAALVVTLLPALVLRATEVEVDLPLALFVTLGCVQSLRLLERVTMRDAIWTGVIAGLAASSKYPGFIALVPAAAALILAPPASFSRALASETEVTPPSGRRDHEAVVKRAAAASGWSARLRLLLVLLAAMALVFFATSPYILLDPNAFWRDVANQ